MKRVRTFLIGVGTAGASLLTSAANTLKPENCAGGCGSCNYACVPTVFVLFGIGGLVIAIRKLKFGFLKKG